jgi:CBS domain containing-hemolysin-like protein
MPLIALGLVSFLLLSFACSAVETAFTSLSVLQIHDLAQKKGRSGILLEKLTRNPDIFLTGILIGNNVANVGASSLTTLIALNHFGDWAVSLAAGILTLVILIFAEVTPKRIAILWNQEIALGAVYPVWFLTILLRPVIVVVILISSGITRFFSGKKAAKFSREGLLHLIKLAHAQGVVKDDETRLVQGVFRFRSITAGTVMTHRTEVFSLDENLTAQEALPLICREGLTRIPVYEKDPENISGVVLSDDPLMAVMENRGAARLKEFARKPLFVPASRKISDLFLHLQKERLNMAVVLDEYGGLAGIITREDILEQLVGELYDENEAVDQEKIVKLGEGRYRIQGDASLYLMGEALNLHLEHPKGIQTIGGYISETLGRLPQPGERLDIPGARLQIETMEKTRIRCLLCEILP